MGYRSEIDGLRAIAIILIILYHAGFRIFEGGYVGVDIFFVISGYLITSNINKSNKDGAFNYLEFYNKRARRILPALIFVVMIFIIPMACQSMAANELKTFSKNLIGIFTFISNILFMNQGGYFDKYSEINPIIHTWSLSIEEQFYLIYPIFIVYLVTKKNVYCITIIKIIIGLSIISSIILSYYYPSASFYLIISRLWEFLIGCVLVFIKRKKEIDSDKKDRITTTIGLMIILLSSILYGELTKNIVSLNIIPVIGTALILYYGCNDGIASKILKNKILVGLGLISYSAYLWHQPIFVFYRREISNQISTLHAIFLIVIILVISYFSYKYVESPCRNKKIVKNHIFLLILILSIITIFALGMFGLYNYGYIRNLTTEERQILSFKKFDHVKNWREGKCFLRPEQFFKDFAKECFKGGGNPNNIVLWGDSYAASLFPGLNKIENNINQLTSSACPPILDKEFNDRVNCKKNNEEILAYLKKIKPNTIVLSSNWIQYNEVNHNDIINTISEIQIMIPGIKVVLIGPFVQWPINLPDYIVLNNIKLLNKIENPLLENLRNYDDSLKKLALNKKIVYISPIHEMCDTVNDCIAILNNENGKFELVTFDNGHLAVKGSEYLSKKIISNF